MLAKVIQIVDQNESAPKELTNVISKDSAMAIRLLRIVNSPFYGRLHQISTINRAIIHLGTRATKAITLSIGVHPMFESDDTLIDRALFLRHSLETAIVCREIAVLCSYEPPEEAFVLGLIHNIGLFILETNFRPEFKRIWDRVKAGEDLVAVEESELGTNHARVGKFLLNRWQIPGFMGEAIAQHHCKYSPGGQFLKSKLARIVNLGNMVTKSRISRMREVDKESIEEANRLSESLGISPIALTQAQSKILEMLVNESELLNIEIGPVTNLLETANKLIYQ